MEQLLETMSNLKDFYLPPIPCSIPFKHHPDYASLAKASNEWITDIMHLPPNWAAQDRCSLYSPFLVPVGSYERALVACKLFTILFIMDDPFEDSDAQEYGALLLRAATTGNYATKEDVKHYNSPSFAAFVEAMSDARALMSPQVRYSFLDSISKIWVKGEVLRQNQYNGSGSPLNMSTYFDIRRRTSFLDSIVFNCAMCLDVDLDKEDMDSPEFQELIALMSLHCGLVNDILSFRVDFYNKKYLTFPGVVFLNNPAMVNFQDAIDRACEIIQEKEAEFLQVHQRLLAKALAGNKLSLQKLLQNAPYIISGNLRWHYLPSRYHGMNNPCITGNPFHGTWVLHPSITIILPPYNDQDSKNKHEFLLAGA